MAIYSICFRSMKLGGGGRRFTVDVTPPPVQTEAGLFAALRMYVVVTVVIILSVLV